MSWQILPNEITVYILKLRNNIRYISSKKIQNAWKKYILPEQIGLDLALDIETDQYNKIIISTNSTVLRLKYILSMCSGNNYLSFWKTVLDLLDESLNTYQYTSDEWLTPEAVNYRKIKILYKKLLTKFNL